RLRAWWPGRKVGRSWQQADTAQETAQCGARGRGRSARAEGGGPRRETGFTDRQADPPALQGRRQRRRRRRRSQEGFGTVRCRGEVEEGRDGRQGPRRSGEEEPRPQQPACCQGPHCCQVQWRRSRS
ncbi:hypothetical protein HK405_002108, partial [Cladochytrium tenue]